MGIAAKPPVFTNISEQRINFFENAQSKAEDGTNQKLGDRVRVYYSLSDGSFRIFKCMERIQRYSNLIEQPNQPSDQYHYALFDFDAPRDHRPLLQGKPPLQDDPLQRNSEPHASATRILCLNNSLLKTQRFLLSSAFQKK